MRRTGARGRLRRTWPQRLLIAFNVVMIVAALTAAASIKYAYRKAGEVHRVVLGGVLTSGDDAAPGGPENFLIVGTDDATGLAPDDPVLIGRPPGLRSDVMMLLRIDPSSEKASLLSLPRDLYVPIAGTKGSERINSAIAGGPERVVETVTDALQVPIDHYIGLNFLGFRDIVDAIGGVPIYFAEPVRDRHSGLSVEEPGCVTLDPVQALAYARSRAYEFFRKGRWHTDGTGDLGRISRQQDFIRRVLHRAIARGARNPAVLAGLIDAGVKSVTLDESLTYKQLGDLGNRFRHFNPETLETFALPVYDDVVRGAAVLRMDEHGSQRILDIFRGAPDEPSEMASFTVGVRNGSGGPGQAAAAAADLRTVGFNVPPGNIADADRFDYEQTVVQYGPGQEAAAELVARWLTSEPELAPADGLGAVDVVVISGQDYAGVLDAPREALTTTSSSDTIPDETTTTTPGSTTSTSVIGEVPGPPPPDVAC